MQNRLSCAPDTAGEEYICYLLALDLDKNRYIIMMREDSVTGDFTFKHNTFQPQAAFLPLILALLSRIPLIQMSLVSTGFGTLILLVHLTILIKSTRMTKSVLLLGPCLTLIAMQCYRSLLSTVKTSSK